MLLSAAWLWCFHCSAADERDTWCRQVGAKCRWSPLNLRDGYLHPLTDSCRHQSNLFSSRAVLRLWGHELWVYQVTSSPLCLCMFVPQWRSGREAQPAPVQAEVSHQFLEARRGGSRWSTSHKPCALGSQTSQSFNANTELSCGRMRPSEPVIVRRGHTERVLAAVWSRRLWTWTHDVGDRKLPA